MKIWFKNEIFDHSGPANDGIWQNLKFSVPFKIWIKIVIFDHSGPVKAEIWQNADILSQVENLAQN